MSNKTIYYKYGIEKVPWVQGYTAGDSPAATENADHVYLEAIASTVATQIGYVTDNKIDLTRIKKLFIDWANASVVNPLSYLVASTSKTGNATTYDATVSITGGFVRQVSILEVTSLVGEYYIRFHARAGSTPRESLLKVYQVWGE